MGKRLVVDGSKVFKVKARRELADKVCVCHRRDYEMIAGKGPILVVDGGNDVFYLVEPVGEFKFLRKTCVQVLGPASPELVVEADSEKGFIARRV
mgnify:CR=1 FL=1